jgi:hypothetical protein
MFNFDYIRNCILMFCFCSKYHKEIYLNFPYIENIFYRIKGVSLLWLPESKPILICV